MDSRLETGPLASHRLVPLRLSSQSTLALLEGDFSSEKVLVDLGDGCFMKGKRENKKIVIRMKEDLWVEFTREEAIPVVKALIKLNQRKVEFCGEQLGKVMGSRLKMEELLAQAQSL